MLIIENEVPDRGGELLALPVPFADASLRSVAGWGGACRPDRVRSSTEVMSGDVSHRDRLAGRQGSELGRIGQPARRGIGEERGCRALPIRTSPRIQERPRSQGVPGPRVVRLVTLEQVQDVLGAHHRPLSQQSVVLVGESAPRDGW